MADIDYLIVAGGGAGSHGGGGGGGVVSGTFTAVTESKTVTVGAGGSSGNGGNSLVTGLTTASGGGRGATALGGVGSNGGCGGGGARNVDNLAAGGGGTGSQGGNGGAGSTSLGGSTGDDTSGSGGGGGAGPNNGGSGAFNNGTGAAGGGGFVSSISGTSTTYAGGGGGGGRLAGGAGGAGGGGAGSTTAGTAGTANTGGGGGGSNGTNADGGSGVVIFRYLTGGGVSATGGTVTTSGSYTIHTFTSNGTLTITTAIPQAVSGSITAAGSLVRSANRSLAGALTPAATLVKATQRALSGPIASAGTLIKSTARQLAGALAPSGALTAFRVVLRSVSGSIAPAGAIVKQANKVIAGVLAPAGSTLKRLARRLVGLLTPSGTTSRRRLTEGSIAITIAGSDYTSGVDLETLTKEETNDFITSNTCSFVYYGGTSPPTELQEIVITRILSGAREFAGTVLTVEQFYDGIRHNIGYRIHCQDFTWFFNKIRNSQKWSGAVSATTIATAIVGWDSGFTTTNIEAGLPTVTDFEVINRTRGEALKLLAEQISATVGKIDYSLDVHFRVTAAAVDLPADVTDVTKSGDNLVRQSASGQIRTRQRGLGVRVRIPTFIPSGSTTVAVESVDKLPASGQLQVGSRTLSFTAQTQTQTPSGIAGVAAAPTVALASTPAGGVLGAVRYCVTFETPDGETAPGAQSSEVTGATVAAPAAATAVAQHQVGVGVSGDWYVNTGVTFTRSGTSFSFPLSNAVPGCRVYIFGTSSGVFDGAWTITSVSGSTATVSGISSSAPASDTGSLQVITDGPLISGGTFSYKIAWLSQLGISALSSAFTISPAGVTATTTATAAGTTGGNLTALGTYTYFYTAYTENGEASPLTLLGAAHTLAGSNNAITLTINALSNGNGWHDGRIRGLRLYRGKTGETVPRLVADFSRSRLAALAAFSGAWTYTDTTADTALGALPASGVMGAAVGITSLPSWSDSRITGLMILRTVAGGSTYFPVGTVSSSSATGFLDTMSDAQLVLQAPVPTTAFGGHQVSLSNIATLAGATARNIYRLLGGVWRYCGTIPDNVTTTFTDKKEDAELGAPLKIGGYLTGLSALTADIVAGEIARLHVVRSDAAAAATVAATMGRGDGYFEGPVLDDDTLGQTGLEAACDAELTAFSAALREVTFRSRDVNLKPGTTITFNLGGTTNIVGTFVIQRVVTTEMDIADGLNPLHTVTAGPVLHTYRKSLGA